jgi:hypothetical protein
VQKCQEKNKFGQLRESLKRKTKIPWFPKKDEFSMT